MVSNAHIVNLGASYAIIDAYLGSDNNQASSSLNSVGVEVSESEDFANARKYTTDGIEGRKFTVIANELEATCKYYYRPFVQINTLYYYGEKRTFTTKDFSNITSTGEVDQITSGSAVITSEANISSIDSKENYEIGIAYSLSKSNLHQDSLFTNVVYSHPLSNIKDGKYEIALNKLESGGTYYYCSFTKIGNKYRLGNIKEFTTTSALEGTWRGNMYMATVWDGKTYDATYTLICFLRDPYRYSSGTGYWIDNYNNAGWGRNYVANHIEWTVNYRTITVYFVEEGTTLWIENYRLDDGYFEGTIYNGESRVDFQLRHTSSPNWNDYYYGWDGYYYDDWDYNAKSKGVGAKEKDDKNPRSIIRNK